MKTRPSSTSLAIQMPRQKPPGSGSALTATTLKKPRRRRAADESRVRSARADGQQDFLAERVLELVEIERRLTFVAEHFEHCWAAFLGHFHASAFDVHDVHLQRFDQKIPVVAAIRTGQIHL